MKKKYLAYSILAIVLSSCSYFTPKTIGGAIITTVKEILSKQNE